MTNAGLRLDLCPVSISSLALYHDTLPLVNPAVQDECFTEAAYSKIFLPIFGGNRTCIYLVKLDADTGSQFARIWPNWTYAFPERFVNPSQHEHRPLQRCFVRDRLLIPRNRGLVVHLPFLTSVHVERGVNAGSRGSWLFDDRDGVERIRGTEKVEGVHVIRYSRIRFHPKSSRQGFNRHHLNKFYTPPPPKEV